MPRLCDFVETCEWGWVGRGLTKKYFFLFLKPVLCFLKTIFTGGLLCRPPVKKRFLLVVYYVDRQWNSIFTGGPQLIAYKNDDFYWALVLAVTKNVTVNRFTTVTIVLLCTSVSLKSSHTMARVLYKSEFYKHTKIGPMYGRLLHIQVMESTHLCW
jgi:hypothetical protein